MPKKKTATIVNQQVGIRLSSHEKLCAERMNNILKSIERLEKKLTLSREKIYENFFIKKLKTIKKRDIFINSLNTLIP